MKYVIHSTVIFDTTKYLLTLLKDNNTSIKLSNAAGHILEELIKHRKTTEPITREYLFSTVWRNHGLEPSHGNLNQQISLIRKSFSLLGIDPTYIVTIPKRGLKLNHQISIKTINENPSSTQFPKNITNHKISKTHWIPETTLLKINNKYTIILLVLIITVLSTGITYLYIKDRNLRKLYSCKQINSCNICTFHQTPNVECNDLSFKLHNQNQNNIDHKNNHYIKINNKKQL